MARSYSNRGRRWRGRRANSAYLIVAVIVFGLIVFVLFRGGSSEPQPASAGEGAPPADSTESEFVEPSEPLVAHSDAQPTTPPAEPTPAPAQPAPQTETQAQPLESVIPTAEPEPDPHAKAEAAIASALALGRSQPGKVLEVRDKLNAALDMPMSDEQRKTVKAEMAKLADEWLFGPAAFAGDPLCSTYMVKSGDVLQIIGRRHKVPYELLMQINNIRRPENLAAGRAIKVVNGPFHAKVDRSTFTLDLYLQDTYVRSFKVGLGKPGYETPTGLWRVKEGGKLIKPTWTDPDTGKVYKGSDPNYPLGSRWIALDGVDGAARGRTGFAIHGTKDPEQIGTAGSRGCIRMYNGDAILMYNLLVPLYSTVEVVE